MPVDIHTSSIPETGEVFLEHVAISDPRPHHVGSWMLETKYNRNMHGAPDKLFNAQIPTGNLLKSLMQQQQAYHKDLKILQQQLVRKVDVQALALGSIDKVLDKLGDDFCDAWDHLDELLINVEPEPYRKGYLTDIFRYWRTVASKEEVRSLEEIWVFVAGRPHRQE